MLSLEKSPISLNSSLSLNGTTSYAIKGDRVLLEIGEISNSREQGFLSGTLSIELWALPEVYNGGGFRGFPLAFATIGELSSQHFISNCRYDLNFRQPPEGKWYFTLMLREWDGHAYITRDYVTFNMPYQQKGKHVETDAKDNKSNVVHLAYKSANEALTDPEKHVLHAHAYKKEVQIEPSKKISKKAKISKKEAKQSKRSANLLAQLNQSSVEDLLSIKGIFQALAESIKAGQPYKELKDLMKIKGLGKKKLEAIRNALLSK